MRIALVGATGMVGTEMLKVLDESRLAISEIIPVASEKSVGKEINFRGKNYSCVDLATAVSMHTDVALFSAGGSVSLEWAPKFAEAGTYVIDNSSAWRMNEEIPLIVPEINAGILTENNRIIANPNCSTIQMVMALKPLHEKYGISRIVVSTYQSVSGTGYKAVNQMNAERIGQSAEKAYHYEIDKNCIPHCDSFLDNGYTKEEMKLVNETRKILGDSTIRITATAVRVPVDGGHSEAVNVELKKPFEIEQIKKDISEMPGVTLQDDLANNIYPMPKLSKGKNDVFVGRIRRDESAENTLNMWVVADNLRKGAATNAVQIAEYLAENNLIKQ
ncbi:MAG: aspartate-semialdehyde dehydrogenase [Flavobacteriales bacterium]|nr:aspartate-semialdehyde dehydrogenase [Flavobacteriales bacterium]